MRVSAICSKRSRPYCAFSIRFCPSTVNGRVTTPMTNAPAFLAMSAITGAEPVPVPPPNPHVIKTKSEFARRLRISCSDSRAASSPILGLLPAPRPPVNSRPIKILTSAFV